MTQTGKVYKGKEFVADVQYQYWTTQKRDAGIVVSLSAHLLIHPATAINPYFSTADMLTLNMADGKKQNFYVESTDGKCRGTGGTY